MLKTDVCNCTYARSRTVRTLATAVMAVATMLAFQAESFAQPANDDCATAAAAVDGGNAYDVTGATLDASAPAPLDANMQNDVWFSYTASCTGELTVETCEGGLSDQDTVLEVHFGGTCPPGPAIGTGDDECGSPDAFASSVTLFVSAGEQYLIRVGGWNGGEPAGTLDITCTAGPLPACCVGDGTCAELSTAACFANPDGVIFTDGTVCADLTDECELQACCAGDGTCTDVSAVLCTLLGNTPLGSGTTCATDSCTAGACCDGLGNCTDVADAATCSASGGNFQGVGTECATTTCPLAPSNDQCVNAIAISVPSLTSGTTLGAGEDTAIAGTTCGTTIETDAAGVWYTVIGDGTTYTATTCPGLDPNAGGDYDTKISVFTGDCLLPPLTCVGGNDDDGGNGCGFVSGSTDPEVGKSTFSWCALPGVEYKILVHGFEGGATFALPGVGNFTMSLSSDGVSCVQACCLEDGTCQDISTADCTSAGGTSQGPGTDCAGTSCPQPEACCLPNGTCQEIFAADCTGLGGTPQGEGRLCPDVSCPVQTCSCNTTVNTFPFVEDFEDDEPVCIGAGVFASGCNLICTINGGWENRANGLFDDTDWSTHEGSTGSGGTGPDVDATTGTATGNDAYIEASSCTTGVAQLLSPCIDLTGTSAPAFSFAYHMFGGDQGTLTVEVSTDSCQNFTQEFTVSGEQSVDGSDWQTGFVDLSAYRASTEVRILITGTNGGDFESDMAIDDLIVFDDSATGACCTASGCTDGVSLTGCAGLGGLYQGDGTDCMTSSCVGACCAGDGTCANVTEISCNANGGNYQGGGTDCMSASCAGACCFADGTCSELGPDSCDSAGGDFQGLGSSCAPNPCPQPPANDDCVDPLPEVFDGANPVDLTQATSSGLLAPVCDFPSAPSDVISNDLFFQYTATCTGELFVDTCGDSFDTRLAIYDADCAALLGGAAPLECNDDHGNATEADTGNTCPDSLSASLSINATMGTTYVIRVGSFSATPQTAMFDLNIACVGGTNCESCEGDVNGDTLIDGVDIQSFIDCYVSNFGSAPGAGCGCADVVDDQLIDALDLDAFVVALLNKPNVCDPGACCFFDGATMCTVTSQQICDTLGGNFTAGGDCSGDPCPVGRCCSNDGATCDDVSEVECASIGGDWDGGLSCATDPCPIPLPNDDCVDAIVIGDGTTLFDTTGALDSGILPTGGCSTSTVANDVWFEYTATCTGNLTIDTEGSVIPFDDSVLAVYDTSCGGARLACDDDGGSGLLSSVTIPVTMGDTLIIQVFGFSTTNDGPGQLNIDCASTAMEACCFPDGSCTDELVGDCAGLGGTGQGGGSDCGSTSCPQPPPANDDCANAAVIGDGTTLFDTTDATDSGVLPTGGCSTSTVANDVWFEYTATCTGNLTIDTEGSVIPFDDSVLAVYDTSCGGARLACDDDGGSGLLSSVTIPVTMGDTLIIQVFGFSTTNDGPGQLNIDCASTSMEACCFPDGSCTDELVGDCAGLGGVGQGGGSNCAGTSCPQPEACCFADASCMDLLTADCAGMGGTSQGVGTDCGTTTCPIPPANDECDNAIDVTMTPYNDVVDLSNATDDANVDPGCDSSFSCDMGPANNGVWYSYTAASAGDLTVVVAGPDTATSFWSGADCNSLTELSCSDPQTTSISLMMGETVLILVSNWSCSSEPTVSATVDITFVAAGGPEACCFPDGSCSDETPADCGMMGGTNQGIGTDCAGTSCPQPPPANDDCANALVVTNGTTLFDTTDATDSGILAACSTSNEAKDVWFEYTATCTGSVTIDTEGSVAPFDDSVLQVFDACGGTVLACDDDGGTGLLSTVTIPVTMGDTLLIQAFGFNSAFTSNDGPGVLNVSCAP